jgi:hypothetical protein
MKKMLQTLRFVSKGFARVTAIGFLCVLGTVALTNLIFHLTDRINPVHQVVTLMVPFEVTSGLIALLIGLALFILNFKVVLANGISRKTYILASLLAGLLVAAALSIFNATVVLVHDWFWPILSIGDGIYSQTNLVTSILLQFALYILLIVAGWFINLVFYRSSTPVRWTIAVTPGVLLGLMMVENGNTNGAVFRTIWEYLFLTMGDPYRASASMVVYSAILFGLVYLLIRRAPLKD